MTDLPAGWARATLGDLLLRIEAGKSFTCEPRPAEPDEWGIIKVSAMTWGTFRESENKAVPAHRAIDPANEIKPGDILVSRANTEAYVGAPVLVDECRPKLLLSDKSLRLVPAAEVDRDWLLYALASPSVRARISARATGTKDSMRNISQKALSGIEILVPPAEEQQRIAVELKAHLHRLKIADEASGLSKKQLQIFTKRILIEAVPQPAPGHWKSSTVDKVGDVDLGRQRHPDWHTGPNMRPYLRVANIFEDRIDTSDVMEMDFPPELFERFRLSEGEILLNEGQSPEYLGRPAMYRGVPKDVAFTNSLLRFRAGPSIDPEWALLVFRRHMHAGRFMREVRITTNIAHLSAGRFKSVEFPVPSLDEQHEIVERVRQRLAEVDLFATQLDQLMAQSVALRRRLLSDAYAGRLVSQDPIDEPAEGIVQRICAERESSIRERTRHTARRVGEKQTSRARRPRIQHDGTMGPVSPSSSVVSDANSAGEQESLFVQEGLS